MYVYDVHDLPCQVLNRETIFFGNVTTVGITNCLTVRLFVDTMAVVYTRSFLLSQSRGTLNNAP